MKKLYFFILITFSLALMSFTQVNQKPIKNYSLVGDCKTIHGTGTFIERKIFLSTFIFHIYKETISVKSKKEDGTSCEDDKKDLDINDYIKYNVVIEKYNK